MRARVSYYSFIRFLLARSSQRALFYGDTMLEVELEWYVVKHDAEDKIKTNLWQYSAYIEHYLRVNEVIRNEDLGYTLTKINAPCSRVARLVGGMLIYNALFKVNRHLYTTTIAKNGDITTRILVRNPREFYNVDAVTMNPARPNEIRIETYAKDEAAAQTRAIAVAVDRLQACTNSK